MDYINVLCIQSDLERPFNWSLKILQPYQVEAPQPRRTKQGDDITP